MPKKSRNAPGGLVYHVMNSANGNLKLFKTDADYTEFEQALLRAYEQVPIRILDWCIMPTHWHLVLWPRKQGELTAFVRCLTLTHTQRWKQSHSAVGQGHLYQGRFKSFPIEQDEHLLTALRFVERNPIRAGETRRAEKWRWGSCHVREDRSHPLYSLLSAWPVPRPAKWLEKVNAPPVPAEEIMLKQAITRGRPLGTDRWVQKMARNLDLGHTLRPRGRPPGSRKRK